MKKNSRFIIIIIAIIIVGIVVFTKTQETGHVGVDHKNTAFLIEGKRVQLIDGYAEETIEDSSAKVITRYFGNELMTDLDGDGAEDDIAFILTQETGGSGSFFYAVGAIHTEEGFKGTDGYLLGDRVAPQSTNLSPNTRHKHVVVFNYADRAFDEPITTQPSVGKSAYLKVSMPDMRWAIVEPDFEGESR